jgi:hypothetical protein
MWFGYKDYKATCENDTWALVSGLTKAGGPSRDKYITAAVRFDVTGGPLEGGNAGMSIFTGEATESYNGNYTGGSADAYRMGYSI